MSCLDRILEPACCCWFDLVAGKACCFYNFLFAPIVLSFHAIRIYLCSCLSLYFKRLYLKLCCILCRTMNCCWKYNDRYFPPNSKSLGKVGGDDANQSSGKTKSDIAWVRASEFSKSGTMQLFGEKVNPMDICQGALGDCWLLAAMACMAEHPGAIQALFRSRVRDPRGHYKLRLFHAASGRWANIDVDDYIPCDKKAQTEGRMEPMFCQPKNNELWPILLEKAFAKLCGSYAELEGGATVWALRAMTGDLARSFLLDAKEDKWRRWDLADGKSRKDSGLTSTSELKDHAEMFKILVKYTKMQSVLSASGASGAGGLHKGHAYSILDVREVQGVRLVQIRNPWGTGEWTGDWSDKSPLWDQHPAVKKAIGSNMSTDDDGAFFMCWEDFIKNWTSIGVVDRSIDIHTVKLNVTDDTICAPTKGCVKGCCRFWCLCEGARRLYCPHRSSRVTVKTGNNCCILM